MFEDIFDKFLFIFFANLQELVDELFVKFPGIQLR